MIPRQKTPKNGRLSVFERLVVLFFVFIISTLFLISFIQSRRFGGLSLKKHTGIRVWIDGEVKKPGWHELDRGATLRDLFAQARPKPFAAVEGLDWKRVLENQEEIVVPKLQRIRCRIEGAVLNPGWVDLPVGTRVCDLNKYITVLPEFDNKIFNKKKKIYNNELVIVTFK